MNKYTEKEKKYEQTFNSVTLSIIDFISVICISHDISENFIYKNKNRIKDFIKNDPQEPIA